MARVRYGLIGAGMMGQEHLRNLALIDGAEIAAIADPDEGMRASSASLASLQVENTSAVFSDYKDLLQRAVTEDMVDAILIAAPNHTHASILEDVLATPFPILVEKPLCTTNAECLRIAERNRGRAAPVWVAMEYRYIPPVAHILNAVTAGEVGSPHMLTIREHRFPFLSKVGDWNRFNANTGGTMVEKCCHFFDLMRLFTGCNPTRLVASGAQSVNHLDECYEGATPDLIDNAMVLVDFENGMRASLELCMFAEGSYFQEEITVIGDQAKIEARVPGPARFWPGGEERAAEIEYSSRAPKQPQKRMVDVDPAILNAGDHHGSTFFQHEKFFNMVRHGAGQPEVSVDDGAWAVRMGAAAEQAIKTGEVVRF